MSCELIKAVQARKACLEREIMGLVEGFEKATGCTVADLDIDRLETRALGSPPESHIVAVRMRVEL